MRRRTSLLQPLIAAAWVAGVLLAGAPAHSALLEGVLEPGDLIKGHAELESDCENCHSHFSKKQQDELCVKCHEHEDIGRDVAQKKGYHGKMKRQACAACHADHKGRNANIVPLDEKKFDHDETNFKLEDKHKDVKCDKCHLPKFKKHREAPDDCYGCHKKDDKHKGAVGEKCEQCHNAKSWKEKDVHFDHDKTKFKLRGAHADPKVLCEDCHPKDHYKKTPVDCFACHKQDDEKKGHRGRFGPKCENCHTDKDWKEIKFDHDKDTKYPLRGKHADAKKVKCEDCHTGIDLYHDKTKTTCIGCHQQDDKHKGVEGNKCEKCHSEKDWKETPEFDHNKTKFPLKGGHADPKVKCEDCHKTKVYTDTPLDCWSCHKEDDEKKGHRGRFGKKCEDCHVEKDWKTMRFDHDRDTKYPLRGKHKDTRCEDCHTGIDLYKDKTKTTCIGCHQQDDKHKGVEGNVCDQCHYEIDWKTTKDKFDHGLTRFPLLGKHADAKKIKCEDCHKSKAYTDAPLDCWSCHEKDDNKTHKRRLGKVCEPCHNAVDWKRWDFDHDRRTRFKLDGAHKKLTCYDCHSKPVDDAKLPMACVACHNADDVHGGSFGKQCERCHVTKDWKTIKSGAGGSARDSVPLAEAMPWVWRADPEGSFSKRRVAAGPRARRGYIE